MHNQKQTIHSILQRRKSLLWVLILIITMIWGYAWVLMKASLEYMGPFTFSSLRFGIGAIVLLLILSLFRTGLPPRSDWKHLIVIGTLQTAVVFLLVMFALRFVEAGKSSVLLYSMPVWSSLLAVKFLGEKLTASKTAGLVIGMIGLLSILGWDVWSGQSASVILGEVLIIVAAISWALSNIYYRTKAQHLPQLQVSALQMSFGAIGIFIATLIMEAGQPVVINIHSAYYVLFTGVLASALCFTAWFLIMSVVDMVTATISTLLVPVFGLVFSSVLLKEQLTTGVIAGSLLIIGGIVVAQRRKPG